MTLKNIRLKVKISSMSSGQKLALYGVVLVRSLYIYSLVCLVLASLILPNLSTGIFYILKKII